MNIRPKATNVAMTTSTTRLNTNVVHTEENPIESNHR
jgi:hypothetical protein